MDATPTSSSITSFALHLLAEFEQVVHQESAQTSKKKQEVEKVKTVKAKKIEEDGGRSPERKTGRNEDEKPKCKSYLTDSGCRKGKACHYSHDLKDERCRCWTCGSPDHMAPACSRPKGPNDSPSPKAKMQRVEGEDSGSTASKEEDPKEESLKMKELLEQANVMLKSLTTTSQNPASSTSTTESEEVMDRLQQHLNQLKLKVFKINQMLVGSHQGLVDSGATHPLRPLRWEKPPTATRKWRSLWPMASPPHFS